MSDKKFFFASGYLLLLVATIYSPDFGAFDKATIQYFLISILNVITIVAIPFVLNDIKIKEYIKHPLIYLYFGYVLFAILSISQSINKVESFVRLAQITTFLISLIIIILFVQKKLIRLKFVLILISSSLLIDVYFSLEAYFQFIINGVSFKFQDNPLLVGLYGNRNILATILAFKIPFLIILSNIYKNKYLNIIIFFIVSLTFFNISILSSRATFLAIIICLFFVLIVFFIRSKKYNNHMKFTNKFVIYYLLPIILASILASNAIDKSDEGNLVNRVVSIASTNDVSKNTRLRYYTQSLKHIVQNPILGGGIGNWKILSIKYDSENIQNYIIPYNAHNDILESAAETGIFGGFLFTSFFFWILYYLFKFLKQNIYKKNLNMSYIFLFMPFITYFIDLNLNFPSSRPSNQVFFLLYLTIILAFKVRENEK